MRRRVGISGQDDHGDWLGTEKMAEKMSEEMAEVSSEKGAAKVSEKGKELRSTIASGESGCTGSCVNDKEMRASPELSSARSLETVDEEPGFVAGNKRSDLGVTGKMKPATVDLTKPAMVDLTKTAMVDPMKPAMVDLTRPCAVGKKNRRCQEKRRAGIFSIMWNTRRYFNCACWSWKWSWEEMEHVVFPILFGPGRSSRDLLEEAKRRATVVIFLIFALAYLMSLTSQSLWMNIPIAALLLAGMRRLYLDVDFNWRWRPSLLYPREAATVYPYPSTLAWEPHTPLMASIGSLHGHGHVASMPPRSEMVGMDGIWRQGINAPAVEAAIDDLIRSVIDEFVTDMWYKAITPDQDAPEELRLVLNGAIAEIIKRSKKVNLISLLARDAVELLGKQLELFRRTRERIGEQLLETLPSGERDEQIRQAMEAAGDLHVSLTSADAEYKVLRRLMGGVVAIVLRPEEAHCGVLRCMARELLACALMKPVMRFASPGYINELILLLVPSLEETSERYPRASATGVQSSGQSSKLQGTSSQGSTTPSPPAPSPPAMDARAESVSSGASTGDSSGKDKTDSSTSKSRPAKSSVLDCAGDLSKRMAYEGEGLGGGEANPTNQERMLPKAGEKPLVTECWDGLWTGVDGQVRAPADTSAMTTAKWREEERKEEKKRSTGMSKLCPGGREGVLKPERKEREGVCERKKLKPDMDRRWRGTVAVKDDIDCRGRDKSCEEGVRKDTESSRAESMELLSLYMDNEGNCIGEDDEGDRYFRKERERERENKFRGLFSDDGEDDHASSVKGIGFFGVDDKARRGSNSWSGEMTMGMLEEWKLSNTGGKTDEGPKWTVKAPPNEGPKWLGKELPNEGFELLRGYSSDLDRKVSLATVDINEINSTTRRKLSLSYDEDPEREKKTCGQATEKKIGKTRGQVAEQGKSIEKARGQAAEQEIQIEKTCGQVGEPEIRIEKTSGQAGDKEIKTEKGVGLPKAGSAGRASSRRIEDQPRCLSLSSSAVEERGNVKSPFFLRRSSSDAGCPTPTSSYVIKLKAQVVGAQLQEAGLKSFVVYTVFVTHLDGTSWIVQRRFRNFEQLHRRLKEMQQYKLKMPPKRFFTHNLDGDFIYERRLQLDKYLQDLLAIPSIAESHAVCDFLSSESQTYGYAGTSSMIKALAGASAQVVRRIASCLDCLDISPKVLIHVDDAMDSMFRRLGEVSGEFQGAISKATFGFRRRFRDAGGAREPAGGARFLGRGSHFEHDGVGRSLSFGRHGWAENFTPRQAFVAGTAVGLHDGDGKEGDANGDRDVEHPGGVEVPDTTEMEADDDIQTVGNEAETVAEGGGEFDGSGEAGLSTPQGTVEGSMFSSEDEDSIPPEWNVSKLSVPLLNLVDEIFELHQHGWIRRQVFWIARQVLELAMGDAIDDFILGKIQLLRREDIIAAAIKWVHKMLWPDNIFFTDHPENKPSPLPAFVPNPAYVPLSGHSSPPRTEKTGGSGLHRVSMIADGSGSKNKKNVKAPSQPTFEEKLEAARKSMLVRELFVDRAPTTLASVIGSKQYKKCALDAFYFLQSPVCIRQYAYGVLELLLLAAFPELHALIRDVRNGIA